MTGRDLPILFSGSMVRAILREIEQPGTGKTQTRRVLRKLRKFGPILEFERSDTRGYNWHFRDKAMRWHDLRHSELLTVVPYQVGDRLWVREAWRVTKALDELAPSDLDRSTMPEWLTTDPNLYEGRKRPGMHLPRWASRITLIVTDVRVERLKEISAEDAIAEGLEDDLVGHLDSCGRRSVAKHYRGADFLPWLQDPIESYANLWDQINGARGHGWETNPFVAAYTFRPVLGNIDEVAR
ncbi:hypothetical protein ACVCNR_00605 [Aquamicrobium terrae]